MLGAARLQAAREHVLSYLAPLLGEHSPVIERIRAAHDIVSLTEASAEAKKIVAASASHAAVFEREVLGLLCA